MSIAVEGLRTWVENFVSLNLAEEFSAFKFRVRVREEIPSASYRSQTMFVIEAYPKPGSNENAYAGSFLIPDLVAADASTNIRSIVREQTKRIVRELREALFAGKSIRAFESYYSNYAAISTVPLIELSTKGKSTNSDMVTALRRLGVDGGGTPQSDLLGAPVRPALMLDDTTLAEPFDARERVTQAAREDLRLIEQAQEDRAEAGKAFVSSVSMSGPIKDVNWNEVTPSNTLMKSISSYEKQNYSNIAEMVFSAKWDYKSEFSSTPNVVLGGAKVKALFEGIGMYPGMSVFGVQFFHSSEIGLNALILTRQTPRPEPPKELYEAVTQ